MPRKIVSFDFDDGLAESAKVTAEEFGKMGLRATFGVSTGRSEPQYGDDDLWRSLMKQGHRIMPHGHIHLKPSRKSNEAIQAEITACLQAWDKRFGDPQNVIYLCPYLMCPLFMNGFLRGKVRAVRGKGDINPMPTFSTWELKACIGGEQNCDEHLTETVQKLIASSNDGWVIYCGHSMKDVDDSDFKGNKWGPMSRNVLSAELRRLTEAGIEVLPAIEVLEAMRT